MFGQNFQARYLLPGCSFPLGDLSLDHLGQVVHLVIYTLSGALDPSGANLTSPVLSLRIYDVRNQLPSH